MAERTTALTLRADRSRNHLSHLVGSLQSQITPAELMGQLVGRSTPPENALGLAQALASQVRKNPVACALIAAGIGWLIVSHQLERSRPAKRARRGVARPVRMRSDRRRGKKKSVGNMPRSAPSC